MPWRPCLKNGSSTETWSPKTSCFGSRGPMIWQFVTLGSPPMPTRKSISLSDVVPLDLLLLKSSTSKICQQKAIPSAMFSRLGSSSITCCWASPFSKGKNIRKFWPRTGHVVSISKKKCTSPWTMWLWICCRNYWIWTQKQEFEHLKLFNTLTSMLTELRSLLSWSVKWVNPGRWLMRRMKISRQFQANPKGTNEWWTLHPDPISVQVFWGRIPSRELFLRKRRIICLILEWAKKTPFSRT